MRAIFASVVALFCATLPLAPRPAAPPGASLVTRTVVVHGFVTQSGDGLPVPDARIIVTGTSFAATTDSIGRYAISVRVAEHDTAANIRVLRIGYQESSALVRLSGDSIRADFALAVAIIRLQEVVTTATGTATVRYMVGNSVTSSYSSAGPTERDPHLDRERYARITDHAFVAVSSEPLSTFSVDVDRASYANVRRFLADQHRLPPPDAVRIEELVNYFPYDYSEPIGEHPIAVNTSVAIAPWDSTHRVVRIGIQARRVAEDRVPPSNLVFLIDVSGSMYETNKLPLVKRAMGLLVDHLRPEDRVAIVVYAGAAGVVLPSTPGTEKDVVRAALDRLSAGGSTAGGAGLRLAYDIAKQSFIKDGNNRVILATDGDFNVGESDDGALTRLIEQRRDEGTYLTVLGFGYDNLNDQMMEQLADKGNGNYAYIDNMMEAQKVFGGELTSTLFTVAKDVKLQVEFNPATVQAYRLIGYEDRALRNEDFANDTKDAGDMGAGHSVTALYDIIPTGVAADVEIERTQSTSRYQRVAPTPRDARRDELMYVSVRYKQPNSRTSRLLQQPVRNEITATDRDFSFALAVASWGMLLRESAFKGHATYEAALALARDGVGPDPFGYRAAFVTLVEKSAELAPQRVGAVRAP